MRNVALVTAKGGNQSLPNKNLIEIAGLPSFIHSINAAKSSGLISSIWVTSEDDRILEEASKQAEVQIIHRPAELAQPLTNHGDVILHAFNQMRALEEFDSVTVLLGNTAMTRGSDIRATINSLEQDETATSAMTVWVAQDDHPFRALRVGDTGYLEGFSERSEFIDTNRQSYPEALFYDQGPWTVRASTLEAVGSSKDGPGPWWWMGSRSVAVRRQWLTGRDTHTQFDLDAQEWWLSGNHSQGLA